MTNVIEIRVTGRNDSGQAFEQVRRQVRETGREAEEAGRRTRRMGEDSNEAGRAASQMGQMLARAGEGFVSMGQSASEAAMSIAGSGSPREAYMKLAAVLTAAPVLAQAAGAAIVLGVGGALAGVGMKAASASTEVQASFAAMKERVVAELQDISKPWESTLLSMSAIGGATFDGLSDSLRAAFGRMAPQVTDFMFDVGDALGGFEPMIDRLSVAFGPMLDTLGDRLPDIVDALAEAFTQVGEAADPRALDMTISAFNGLVGATSEVIRFLEVTGNQFAIVWDWSKKIGGAYKDLFGGDTAGDAAGIGEALASVGGSALDAAASIADLRGQMEQLAGKELSARDAARNFEEAIDAAAESAKKHGKTLNINTAAGRANQKALDNIAASALEMKGAIEEAGGDSSAAMARARSSFIRTATGMKMSRAEAERLANKLGLVDNAARRIPKQTLTKVREQNARSTKLGLDAVASAVNRIPNGKHVTVSFSTVGEAALSSALQLLNSIPGAAGGKRAHGGIVGATPAAGGGPRSGWTLVGEQGPELIKVAPGSTVVPAGQTATMLNRGMREGEARIGGGPSSGPPTMGYEFGRSVALEIRSGGSAMDDLLVELLRKAVRVRGGDVQVVLGR